MFTPLSPVHLSVSFFFPSRGLLLTVSNSSARERCTVIHHHYPVHTHPSVMHTHTRHIYSLSFLSLLQSVQQSICCYLSVSLSLFPHSVPPLTPSFSLCPFQSLSQLPGFVHSPLSPFWPITGPLPNTACTTTLPFPYCPLLTVQFAQEAHGTFRLTLSTQQK